jgi:hypothetical protein
MLLQLGRCAFTAACSFPGPRYRLRGTNREVCVVHARSFQIAIDTPSPANSSGGLRDRIANTVFFSAVKKG